MQMSLYAIPNFIVAFIMFATGFFVFLKNKKSGINILFFLSAAAASIWQTGTAFAVLTNNPISALVATKFAFFGITLIPIFSYHLSLYISGVNKNKTVIFGYFLAFFCFIPLSWTSLILNGVYKYSWGYFFKAGILHPLFMVYFFCFMILIFTTLFFDYRKESRPVEKNRKKYFLYALFIAYIGSIDYLPTYGVDIYPFGYLTLICFVLMFAYAILRFRIMDIDVAITRTTIFALVYTLVLGIPFGLAGWGKDWLLRAFGQGWYWLPMFLLLILATAGPFVFRYLRKRAEDILLRDQRRYQSALAELSRTMARIRDLNELVRAIAKEVVETVKVSFSAVYIYSEDYKSYQLKECYPAAEKERFQELITPDYHLVSLLNQQKKPILSEEISSMDKIRLNNGLVIPCFIGDSLIAFLAIGSKGNNQMYTPDDILSFETLSYSTALAIENSQFWKEIEERQRQARIAEMDLFSYSVAHEIDNPMSVIKGQVGLIRKTLRELGIPKDKLKNLTESLDFIDDAQDRTSTMVNAIEDYGKPVPADLVTLKLEDVVSSFFMLYKPQFKHEGVYFEKEISVNLPLMKGIKQELVQVLVNFANNSIHAVKAVPQGQQKIIRLKAELPSPDLVRISFSDNGYGIVKDKIKAVFAPFVTTKASTEGKGMGLSTVTKIIQKHHGRVWAESPGKGKGATMIVELPIAKDDSQEPSKGTTKTKRMF